MLTMLQIIQYCCISTKPNKDPKIAPIRADLLLLGVSVIDVEVGLDVFAATAVAKVVVDDGDCGDDDGDDGVERSKVVVHVY